MARRNIFEIAKKNYNFDDECKRLYGWFIDTEVGTHDKATVEEYVDAYIILYWKARESFRTTEELLDLLGLNLNNEMMGLTHEEKILWLEYALNMITMLYYEPFFSDNNFSYRLNHDEIDQMRNDMIMCLDNIGYEVKAFINEQQVIIVQKNAYTSSVAELVDDDLARQIFEYNRFNMKGDIEEKAKIIVRLAKEYESFEKELKKTNSTLCTDLGFMLNKFHLRHNNEKDTEKDPYCKKFLELSTDEQEEWYDKTYDLLLLAFLSKDGNEIHKELDEFKKN